jgi:hypothetical protein
MMLSDEKLAALILHTINSLPDLAGAEKKKDVFPIMATLIQVTALVIEENHGADRAMEVLAEVLAELAPRSKKMADALATHQQLRAAQKGQFDA